MEFCDIDNSRIAILDLSIFRIFQILDRVVNCRFVRYEDLVYDMTSKVEELILFLGAKMDPKVDKFIQNAMKPVNNWEMPNEINTPDEIVNKWRKQLTWDNIQEIQEDCQEAMKVWGYTKINNIEELFDQNLKLFKPLLNIL
jgi:hypothetical protein